MGDDKEIKIGDKVIGENTKISFSVKTAIWIIGIVITIFTSAFTMAYINVKADVKSYKEKIDQSNATFVKQVGDLIDQKLDKQRDRDDKFIEDIAKIKGDIQLILDRTQRLGGNTVIDGAPTIHNNTPDNNIPERKH